MLLRGLSLTGQKFWFQTFPTKVSYQYIHMYVSTFRTDALTVLQIFEEVLLQTFASETYPRDNLDFLINTFKFFNILLQ